MYLCSRNLERGNAAIAEIHELHPGKKDRVHLVQIDTSQEDSIKQAAKAVEEHLQGQKLYAIVNNAGIGKADVRDDLIATNFYGPKRVCDAFFHLLNQEKGRIVHVGSGAGPGYVKSNPDV